MEPSAGMVHDLILDRHLRRLDARLLLRNEVGIPRNSVHQVNELEGRKLEDEGSSCCCFAMSFDVDIEFTDVFDFVPDRSWLTWSGFRYNILALPFSYVYNERLGASRPTVNAHIKEHWGKLLCGKE